MIVVGVDNTDAAVAALDWAVEECKLRATSLRVVHAWQMPVMPFSGGGPLSPPMLESPAIDPEELRRLAQAGLDHIVAGLTEKNLELESLLVEGDTAQSLLDAAAGAELLVVGSRGHSGLSALLLGSVGQACALHAHCPLVIVRPAQPDA
jgi:nucleotide-binding universal stress UspA family protein